ncbi:tRNA preQ1(34) S-adenosylmethionine ribosyltransferase-isomerase QueA [Parvibaculaceae bacterium PLY_AMNH_Bact1]|nr:tRNA preQ1(34) S-adenosylmethionine ribosyltransferase-isomerase QueA [Parvibaculaceae bacterium PLY_AMNH_Bact1]
MRVDVFDFDLPDARIALRPARPRDSARLLVVGPAAGHLTDSVVSDLPDLLEPGDVLVFNDTKVIPARLSGTRERNGAVANIEVTLHQRIAPDEWLSFVKPAKRLAESDIVRFPGGLEGAVLRRTGGEVHFKFSASGPALDIAIAEAGVMPLPPYIASKRATDEADLEDYQTLFADEPGAVAAPTAGLHFTPNLMNALAERGIETAKVTLHVGAGTFLPVSVDDTDAHKMHSEVGVVTDYTADQLNRARARGGRIISVGTTSLRLLESAASEDGVIHAWSGATDIFITPGYRFKAIDALMTNFHLPKSTLFMLVSAFRSLEEMQAAYVHAIEHKYRFYSYGDACLIFPET